MRMENAGHERFEPLCKFGPGGDFVWFWPSEPSESAGLSPNSLGKLLARLGEIMNGLLSSHPGAAAMPGVIDGSTNRILRGEGNLEYAHENFKTDETTYAASSSITGGDSGFSGEPMLFADDWRVGRRVRHKPKHHIRAYRRTAKKRTTVSGCGQGSLFDADLRSAKSA
jgi:hypothetical protein